MIGHFYEVEKILGKRKTKDDYEYLIKWKGYKVDESTWEPENNLFTIRDLIEEYNAEYEPQNLSNKKRGRPGRKKRRKFIGTSRVKEMEENNNPNPNPINNMIDNVKPYFMLDNSIDEILGVKLEKNELFGIVKRKDKNGKVFTEKMSTEDIKKTNPWILVDFYESKIICQ